MATLSLYTGKYGEDLKKFTMSKLDLIAGIFKDTENSQNFDYQLNFAYKSQNPLSGDENWVIGLDIPLKGVNFVDDSGDEICGLKEWDRTTDDYIDGSFTQLETQPNDFYIYFNDYFTKATGDIYYTPCTNNNFTPDKTYQPEKGFMSTHYYTYGMGYFSLKHIWRSIYWQPGTRESASAFYSTPGDWTDPAKLTGFYRMGGMQGQNLVPFQMIYDNLLGLFTQESGVINSATLINSKYKFKFVGFTLPGGKQASKGNYSNDNWGGGAITNDPVLPDTDLNFIGIALCIYSDDGILNEVKITATTLDFWQKEGMTGNFGEDSGVEGGDGTFTAVSDGYDAEGVITNAFNKDKDKASFYATFESGIHLYSNFDHVLLFDKLFDGNIFDKFKQNMYNPLTSVLSLHTLPKYFNGGVISPMASVSPDVTIKLAGYDTKVSAKPYVYTNWSRKIARLNLDSLYFDGFPDYQPYTTINLHLPFCGVVQVSPTLCMGGYIDIVYNIDCSNGNICVNIVTCDRDGNVFSTMSAYGNCAYTLPIMSSVNNLLGNAVSTVVTAGLAYLTENPKIAAAAVMSAFNTVTTQNRTQVNSSGTSNQAFLDDWTLWAEITRPVWNNPAKYKELVGIPSDISGTINANDSTGTPFTGFLKCKTFETRGIIGATTAEKNEIERLLTTGIHI